MNPAVFHPFLTEALSRPGFRFTEPEPRGILGGNYLRVLGESVSGIR